MIMVCLTFPLHAQCRCISIVYRTLSILCQDMLSRHYSLLSRRQSTASWPPVANICLGVSVGVWLATMCWLHVGSVCGPAIMVISGCFIVMPLPVVAGGILQVMCTVLSATLCFICSMACDLCIMSVVAMLVLWS